MTSELAEVLRRHADTVIRIERPGALSAAEVLGTAAWFADRRRKQIESNSRSTKSANS